MLRWSLTSEIMLRGEDIYYHLHVKLMYIKLLHVHVSTQYSLCNVAMYVATLYCLHELWTHTNTQICQQQDCPILLPCTQ